MSISNNVSFADAIKSIVSAGKEIEAIISLTKSVEKDIQKLNHDNSEMFACLQAIKKFNNDKNDVIAALCERD